MHARLKMADLFLLATLNCISKLLEITTPWSVLVRVPGWDGMVTKHIGELKHLRYLSFWRYDPDEETYGDHGNIILTSTFGKLYHLQSLYGPDFEVDCSKVESVSDLEGLGSNTNNHSLNYIKIILSKNKLQ